MEAGFAFVDPELGRRTRVVHIALVAVGTLLMLPAGLILFAVAMVLGDGLATPGRPGEWAAVLSAVAGSVSGGLAWCALCLLFFKRADPRWHLAAWSLCALHGLLTLPGIVGWAIFLARELGRHWPRGDLDGFLLLLLCLGILGNAAACTVVGIRNARLARRSPAWVGAAAPAAGSAA